VKLQYALAREDLTGLVKALRKLPKDHRVKLITTGYSRLVKWIDWHPLSMGTASNSGSQGYIKQMPVMRFKAGGERI